MTSYKVSHDSKLQPEQDPDTMDGARDRFRQHEEGITDLYLASRVLKGLPNKYE